MEFFSELWILGRIIHLWCPESHWKIVLGFQPWSILSSIILSAVYLSSCWIIVDIMIFPPICDYNSFIKYLLILWIIILIGYLNNIPFQSLPNSLPNSPNSFSLPYSHPLIPSPIPSHSHSRIPTTLIPIPYHSCHYLSLSLLPYPPTPHSHPKDRENSAHFT